VKQLHAADGIGSREVTRDAPVEERFQDREVFVDGTVTDCLGASQFDRINVSRCDLMSP
jgi:hypothetical protein